VFLCSCRTNTLDGIDGQGGNPTVHKMVQQLIKDVVALETEGLGKPMNDKRPYQQVEWNKVLELLQREPEVESLGLLSYPSD